MLCFLIWRKKWFLLIPPHWMNFPPSSEIDTDDILNCEDSLDFHWISTKEPDQRYVKGEFTTPMPPSIPKVEAHTSNMSAMSDSCRFSQVVLSLLPIEGFDIDFDLGVEQGDSSLSDWLRKQLVLYADSTFWHKLMTTKDLRPELLR